MMGAVLGVTAFTGFVKAGKQNPFPGCRYRLMTTCTGNNGMSACEPESGNAVIKSNLFLIVPAVGRVTVSAF